MKKILFVAPFLFSLLVSSCASGPIKQALPPQRDRLEAIKAALLSPTQALFTPSNESEELAKTYLQAMIAQKEGNKKLACALFSELTERKSLAIKDAALVHSLAVCDFSKRELINLWKEAALSQYLNEAYFEISRNLAAEKKLLTYEAEFSFALIRFKKTQKEKVNLINRSVLIAEELNDREKLALYTQKRQEISPQYITEINDKNIYSIAKDNESSRNFPKARDLYLQIIAGNFTLEEKVKAYNSYRLSFKVQRDLKNFLVKTYEMEHFLQEEANKQAEDQKTIEAWIDSKIALARAVWTDHKNAEARKILDEIITLKKGTINQLATVQFIFGSLHLENKELAQALKCFEKASALKPTDIALLENIQWTIVWNHYLLKNDSNVISSTEKFIKKTNNQNFVAKLNYWKGKSHLRMGKTDGAKAIFDELMTSDPFGYYGILASIELEKPLLPLTSVQNPIISSGNQVLDWLIAMEEKEFSQKLLKEIDTQFKTHDEREKAMSLYAQTEWYQGGMRQIYNFKMGLRNAMTEKHINVVFPTPNLDAVDKMSLKYSVPKELIYAITRQESAFVASERSWADAFGLMQLIPEKAVELSKAYNITYHDYNDLYNPIVNIEMGSALLKKLREKFQYKFAQSVASYNASEVVIRTWEKERFNGNYFEFIEMIPYEETRNYIKLVFRNYITYKRIFGKEAFILDKDFFAKPFN